MHKSHSHHHDDDESEICASRFHRIRVETPTSPGRRVTVRWEVVVCGGGGR